MPLDFPNSPAANSTYTDAGKTWVYNGTSWTLITYTGALGDGVVNTAQLANSAVTSDKIADNTIINADINSAAAIAHSKLASIAAGSILMGNSSNVATATALTGDVTITNAGVTAIASNTVVNADINSAASIDIGKIADATIDNKTSNYVLVLSDKNKIIEMNVGSANTLTVPTNSNVAFPIGSQLIVFQQGAGKTQIIGQSGVTIRSTPGVYLRAQYSSATLLKRATDEWYLSGDTSST